MSDIFISYARSERDRAELICGLLRSEGFKVFLDVDGLEAGDFFPDILDREVKSAAVVLGLWTPTSLTRPWVKIECDIAKMRNVLVPLEMSRIEQLDVPANFWGLQRLDFTKFNGDRSHPTWTDLVVRLRSRLGVNQPAVAPSAGERVDGLQAAPTKVAPPTGAGGNQINEFTRWMRVKEENEGKWEIIRHDIQIRIEHHPVFSKSFYKYVVATRMYADVMIGDVHIENLMTPKRFRLEAMAGHPGFPGYQLLLHSDQMKLEPIQVRWMEERSAGLVLRRTDGVDGVYSADTFADEVCRAIAKYLGSRRD